MHLNLLFKYQAWGWTGRTKKYWGQVSSSQGAPYCQPNFYSGVGNIFNDWFTLVGHR